MKKRRFYFFLVVFLFLLVEVSVYYFLNQNVDGVDKNLKERGIETIEKLYLNGYLGVLFGFKYSGNINWIILPLFVIYLIQKRFQISRVGGGMFLFLLLSMLLIGLKGYFNARYQYTLVLVIICLIMYLLWELRGILDNVSFRVIIGILVLFSFFNMSFELMGNRVKEKFNMVFGSSIKNNDFNNSSLNNFDTIEVDNLLEYIESISTNKYFLVNNLPDFYYYTSKKGYYYWCGNDEYYSEEGIKPLFNQDMEKVYYQLKKMNCKYIYTYKLYFEYNKNFDLFIKKYCVLIAEDRDNRVLYKILDNFKE